MHYTEILAFSAGLCTTGSALPQVYHVYKTHSSKDISYASVIVAIAGTALWLTYGAFLKLYLLIFWNVMSFILANILLGIKIHHDKVQKPQKHEIIALISASDQCEMQDMKKTNEHEQIQKQEEATV